jgi:hypothetical protein
VKFSVHVKRKGVDGVIVAEHGLGAGYKSAAAMEGDAWAGPLAQTHDLIREAFADPEVESVMIAIDKTGDTAPVPTDL